MGCRNWATTLFRSVFVDIGRLDGLQHGIQGILILGGADDLTVDGENGDLHHLADLVEEIGLYLTDGHQVLPQRQVVGVVHGVGQGVVIAETTAGPGLYPVYGGGYHLAAFHHAHTLTVQGHLVPGAVEVAQHAGGGEGEGHR